MKCNVEVFETSLFKYTKMKYDIDQQTLSSLELNESQPLLTYKKPKELSISNNINKHNTICSAIITVLYWLILFVLLCTMYYSAKLFSEPNAFCYGILTLLYI